MTLLRCSAFACMLLLLGACGWQEMPMPSTWPAHLQAHAISSTRHVEEVLDPIASLEKARDLLIPEAVSENELVAAFMAVDGLHEGMLVKHFDLQTMNDLDGKKDPRLEKSVRSLEGSVRISWLGKLNGVNTPFDIAEPKGYVVLALKRIVNRGGDQREARIYFPYTRHIDTPWMRAEGYRYVLSVIEAAKADLDSKRVRSRSFTLISMSLIDTMPASVSLRLAIIEHIDPSLIGSMPIEELANRVLVTIAANKENAYSVSYSTAHAYGLFQFIEFTYLQIVKEYPSAQLNPKFTDGMRDHVNAAKASMLLSDENIRRLPWPTRVRLWLHPGTLCKFLASMYNSGKAEELVYAYGKDYQSKLPHKRRRFRLPKLPLETQIYTKEMDSLNSAISN